MVDDLGDAFAELRSLKRRIERLESGSAQESMSVDRGRMRIGEGEFLVDGDGLFRLVGTFDQTGVYNLKSGGDFNVEDGGDINVEDGGDITVKDGGVVRVNDGGNVTVDGPVPLHLKQINVAGAPQAAVQIGNGANAIYGRDGNVVIQGGDVVIQLGTGGISLFGVSDGTATKALGINEAGKLVKIPAGGTGGPGGPGEPGEDLGRFQWPFSLSLVTSEYGPRNGGFHEGIDFAGGAASLGNAIGCAGDGTVADAITLHAGWGNYVRVVHTLSGGGLVSTLYAHMNQPPLVSVGEQVTKGQTLGYVGNTGNSFGAHLHFETWAGATFGSHMNPRNFMAQYGPE